MQVDSIEDSLLAGRLPDKRLELGKLRRALVRLQRLLAPEPGALFRMQREPPTWAAESNLDESRQSTEEFSLVLSDREALQDCRSVSGCFRKNSPAQVGEQTNRSLITLTVVTVKHTLTCRMRIR